MGSTANPLLPVEGATEPFWHRDKHELHNHRSTESLPDSCDVVIIGAGYAGVSTAYSLVNEVGIEEISMDPFRIKGKISITILEARGACSGATGRNGK
jgi:NADH dehydrogenase FAD-containing subunit